MARRKKSKPRTKAKSENAAKRKARPKAAKKAKSKAMPKAKVAKAMVDAPQDPIGACFWTDSQGQPHCEETTQSACKTHPGSTFRAGKRCS